MPRRFIRFDRRRAEMPGVAVASLATIGVAARGAARAYRLM
jgi:hypothetical protein